MYPPGLNLLPLFAEILALLPPARRWSVTFNTYFNQLPRGSGCAWRGCVAGSPALQQVSQVPGAGIVDLTEPLGPCGSGALVEAARSGALPDWAAVEPGTRGSVVAAPAPHGTAATGETPADGTPDSPPAAPTADSRMPESVPQAGPAAAAPPAAPPVPGVAGVKAPVAARTWLVYALLITVLLLGLWGAWRCTRCGACRY